MTSRCLYYKKLIRKKNYDYSKPGYYFVTLYVKKKCCFLSQIGETHELPVLTNLGEIVEKELLAINRNEYAVLDQYIIMPNYIHSIVKTNKNSKNKTLLPKIIKKFKTESENKLNKILKKKGLFWHRNYYEIIIKNQRALDSIRKYIINNSQKRYIENLKKE